MTTKFCVLNLTATGPAAKRLSIGNLSLGDALPPITDPVDIPTIEEPLILYIVGHAVPDTLLIAQGEGFSALDEEKLVASVKACRGNYPTLIIWDLCYARTFQKIKGPGWAKKPYVHIFGCQAYEQSWHTGPQGKRQTLLSLAIQTVINDGIASWYGLTKKLEAQLGRVQRPSMLLPFSPADFGIAPPSDNDAASIAQQNTAKTGRQRKSPDATPSNDRRKDRAPRAAARPSATRAGSKRKQRK